MLGLPYPHVISEVWKKRYGSAARPRPTAPRAQDFCHRAGAGRRGDRVRARTLVTCQAFGFGPPAFTLPPPDMTAHAPLASAAGSARMDDSAASAADDGWSVQTRKPRTKKAKPSKGGRGAGPALAGGNSLFTVQPLPSGFGPPHTPTDSATAAAGPQTAREGPQARRQTSTTSFGWNQPVFPGNAGTAGSAVAAPARAVQAPGAMQEDVGEAV